MGIFAGFARADINPLLGIGISGYYVPRIAQGVLDNLEANVLALRCGETTAFFISVDNCGLAPTCVYDRCREHVARRTGTSPDAVFLSATHTHTSPAWGEEEDPASEEYTRWLENRIADTAVMAAADLKPARMGFGTAYAPHVAFVRRFRMRDGSIRTNPGINNPEIEQPAGSVDERVHVLRFARTQDPDILLVNFGNHPDVVGGEALSADWPGFLRRRVEKSLDHVKCIFFNGAQGDVNHVNVCPSGGDMNDLTPDFDDVVRGYGHARHIGNVVAGAVLQVFDKVCWTRTDRLVCKMRKVEVASNLPAPGELELARIYAALHREGKDSEIPYKGMELTTVVAEAERMLRLEHGPVSFSMPLSAVAIGDVAMIGLPGEPFTGIGTALKEAPGWEMILPCCITNGYEGYFPMKEAYDEGGYEARSSIYAAGVAEKLIEEGLLLLDGLRVGKGGGLQV